MAARLAEAREFLAHEPRAARVVTLRTEECGGEEWMFNERHACCLAFRSTLDQQLDEPYCGSCRIPDEAYRLDRFRRAATRYAERFPTIDEARPERTRARSTDRGAHP